jgi:hypothetical protein
VRYLLLYLPVQNVIPLQSRISGALANTVIANIASSRKSHYIVMPYRHMHLYHYRYRVPMLTACDVPRTDAGESGLHATSTVQVGVLVYLQNG